MKPTLQYDETLLGNDAVFADPFFARFALRHAAEPLRLDERVSKNYRFPTFYADVTCAQAIFLCPYARAAALMPHPRVKPVRMPRGRAVVAFSCYEYKNVLDIPPYNEIAMTVPVVVEPRVNVPVLPLLMPRYPGAGYYVFSMPVTSLENQIRGVRIWGLPKVVQEIDIREEGRDCVTTAFDPSGEPYFTLRVPMDGAPTAFDVRSNLYTRRGGEFLQSETNFKATFNVTKHMGALFKTGLTPDRTYIEIGDTPCGRALAALEIEPQPFQLRFARHMSSCFDLPNPGYRSAGIRF